LCIVIKKRVEGARSREQGAGGREQGGVITTPHLTFKRRAAFSDKWTPPFLKGGERVEGVEEETKRLRD